MVPVEQLTYEQAVARAYYLVTHILDDTWSPKDKRELLTAAAPYFSQIAAAEEEAYNRSRDTSRSEYEQVVARRDESILNIAGRFVADLATFGRLDQRMEILVSTPYLGPSRR